ncbi:MAG: toxin-antitoxin system HicB family antitoxin [Armatimonadetes bacterium]|nr:toxin-antitoxin system HicB family antitoxin [Armatimonadota bacterium]
MTTTISIRLEEDLVCKLRQAATRERMSVNQFIVEAATDACARALDGPSAYDALADVIGCIDSAGRFDASRADDEFADGLAAQAVEGRL